MLHRRAALCVASICALSACTLRPRAANAQWYDPAPLLASLRAQSRATLPAAAGIARLDALPLYDLALDADPEAHSFRVREELYFTNNEAAPLADLVLRLYANTTQRTAQGAVVLPALRMTRSGCRADSGADVPCAITADSASVLTVRPAQPIAPGQRIRVWIELDGRLDAIDSSRTNLLAQGMESFSSITQPSDPSAASASDYGLLAVGDGIACLAQWYPVLAPRRGNQWVRDDRGSLGDLGSDELSHVRARVSFPDGYRTVTTGVTVRESVGSSSVAVVNGADAGATVLRNPRRTHEVVAAMVRDFTVLSSRTWVALERRVGDVTVRSHVLPNERAAGQRVLDAAAGSLEVYERRFGPYPYADLDVCEAAVVGGAGGVEFAGLVTVASMFYRDPSAPNASSSSSSGMGQLVQQLMGGAGGLDMSAALGGMLEFVTAHEVAHQWWHGLVGSDSRDHPFVDEALAQYSAIVYLEDRYGRARAQRDGDANVKNNYHLLRALGQPDQAVNRAVATFRTPVAYAGIVYGKAPYFYEAARRALGDAAFFAAMQRYVRDNAFRVAPPNAIIDALAQGDGALRGRAATTQATRVRALARRWLEETHGDTDLGRASLGTLAARMMGETDPARVREMEQMFEMLERTGLIRSLLGGGGQSGGGLNLGALIQNGSGTNGTNAAGASGGQDALVQTLMRALSGSGGAGAIDLSALLGGGGTTGGAATPRTNGTNGAGRAGGSRGAGGSGASESQELMELLRQFMQ
jgi:hypothetical protein